MAKVIEHAHEQDDVETLADRADVIHREWTKFDIETGNARGKARLIEITLVAIDAQHPRGTASLHLDGIEAAVAANVEDALAGEILRDLVAEALPHDGGKIAEKMIGRGGDAGKAEIVEP